ncbi:MAG: hypothetical protein HY319_13300 [Armatimonadetes bacterium]|nr:hypothetical protein [Armatimonadota bacterium]
MRDPERGPHYWSLRRETPDRLEFQGSGACAGWALILLGGLVVVLSGWWPVGLAAVGTGIGLFFTGSRAVFDRPQGRLFYRKAGLFGFSRREIPLSEFGEVRCGREYVPSSGRSGGYHLSTVDVVGGSESFRLGATRLVAEVVDEAEMRRLAERLAQFLQVPLLASFSGEDVVTAPEDLDRNLGSKLGPVGPAGSPPAGCAIEVQQVAEGLRYLLPAPGFGGFNGFFVAFSGCATATSVVLAALGAVAVTSGNDDTPPALVLAACAGLVGFSLMFLMAAIRRATAREELLLRPDRFTRSVMVRGRSYPRESVSFQAVEDLRRDESSRHPLLPGEPPILVVSDQTILRLGQGMTRADSDWLLEDLRYRIAGAGSP